MSLRQTSLDEMGNTFNRWTVIGEPVKLGIHIAYKCRCICGTERIVRRFQLKHNLSISCGCYAVEVTKKSNSTHGMTNSPEFSTWDSMKDRCYSKGRKDKAYYHDKGIRVCDRWLGKEGFMNFYKDMGPRPKGMTIDRIDNSKGYSPENCRWATVKQQARNTSWNRIIEYQGRKYVASELAEKYGMGLDTFLWRFKNWKDINKVLSTPLKSQKNSRRVNA